MRCSCEMFLVWFGASKRWARAFRTVVSLFAIVGVLQLVSWLDRSEPLTVHSRVIQTISVRPGDQFKYINFFTRHHYCDTNVTRWFITSDDQRIDIETLPTSMVTTALNIRQSSQASITTPRVMPPGISMSCFQSTWQCNPIQRLWPLKGRKTCIDFIVKDEPPGPIFPSRTSSSLAQGEP